MLLSTKRAASELATCAACSGSSSWKETVYTSDVALRSGLEVGEMSMRERMRETSRSVVADARSSG